MGDEVTLPQLQLMLPPSSDAEAVKAAVDHVLTRETKPATFAPYVRLVELRLLEVTPAARYFLSLGLHWSALSEQLVPGRSPEAGDRFRHLRRASGRDPLRVEALAPPRTLPD